MRMSHGGLFKSFVRCILVRYRSALPDIHAYTDFICAAKNLEDTYGSYHWAGTSRLPEIVALRSVSASRLHRASTLP
jgi:hypothetical protein